MTHLPPVADLVALLMPLHLGPLHPVERALTLVLAFGPFLVLGFVVWWRSRNETDDEEDPAASDADHGAVADERPGQRER